MELQISVMSRTGGRVTNEDACGFWSTPGACFCVVSDGAGGHGGGDVASRLAVRTVLTCFERAPESSGAAIQAALQWANQAIIHEQQNGPRLANMRATVVVLTVDTSHRTACWGHLGDSRLYHLRNGRVATRTKDHSVVQKMVDAGYLRDQDLRKSQQRGRLFAALGQAENFEPAVELKPTPLMDGDAFLLCTDGCWEYVEETDLERTFGTAVTAEEWLRLLEARVLELGPKDQDNYSALAVWCSDRARL
jgi:PPM family protein phosphatase